MDEMEYDRGVWEAKARLEDVTMSRLFFQLKIGKELFAEATTTEEQSFWMGYVDQFESAVREELLKA